MNVKLLLLVLGMSAQVYAHQFSFNAYKVTSEILKRMPYTWRDDSPVACSELRYVKVTHYDFKGDVHMGELVVHVLGVEDLAYIFEKLFKIKFPISSIKLVDEFKGSDDASVKANNTSAFCARKVAGTNSWSNHSYGLAIDINPLLNPIHIPKRSPHVTTTQAGIITPHTYIYKLFKERGWEWGGECFFERDGVIDRHHFQKVVTGINKKTN